MLVQQTLERDLLAAAREAPWANPFNAVRKNLDTNARAGKCPVAVEHSVSSKLAEHHERVGVALLAPCAAQADPMLGARPEQFGGLINEAHNIAAHLA